MTKTADSKPNDQASPDKPGSSKPAPKVTVTPGTKPRDPKKRKAWKRERAIALGDLRHT